MKNVCFIAVCIATITLWSCGGKESAGSGKKITEVQVEQKETYAPGEQAAQQVLVAYITKNVGLLKEYAGGIMKSALDEDAMDRPLYKERLEKWDGKIRAVRYKKDHINFQDVWYAYACWMGDPETDEKICVVNLKTNDRENWVIGMNSLSSKKKADWAELSETMPE